MQQCMKSDISSTQGNRAVVPAFRGHGHSGLLVGRRHDSHAFGNSGCDSRDVCSGGCGEVRLVLVGFL